VLRGGVTRLSGEIMADGLLGAYFGNPNLQRQAAKARALAKQRDVNLLPDPKTYAVVQSLLGTAPDELGFSVMHPKYQEIKQAAEPAYALGLLGQITPVVAPAATKAAMAAGRAGERYAERVVPQIMERGGMPASLLGDLSTQTVSPLTVYQGSPHKFAPTAKNPLGEFDPTKIGTGEGAQAFGYGHYTAEAKKLGEYYRDILSQDIANPAKKTLEKFGGDVDAAIQASKAEAQRLSALDLTPETGAAKRDQLLANQLSKIDELTKYKNTGEFTSGYLYEIDLPDEQIAKMLDWDKPISKQKDVMDALRSEAEARVKAKMLPEIRNEIASKIPPQQQTGDWMTDLFGVGDANIAINKQIDEQAAQELSKMDLSSLISKEMDYMKPVDMTWEMTGKQLYELMSKISGSAQKASEVLRGQGIPGIRYLDQASRDIGGGTSNFVVFPGNEDLLTILKRNGGLLD
jgi:hypothetical protein